MALDKVLIQTNTHFTLGSWENIFRKYFSDEELLNIDLHYVKTLKELNAKLPYAKVCFSFNLPAIDLINHLDLLYLGISDINYMDEYKFPIDFNIRTSKGLASRLIAEHTLLQALALIRKFPRAILNQGKRRWDQSDFFTGDIRSIRDYKIGVVGLGNNGKAIAEIFRKIGCWVQGYSNNYEEGLNIDRWYASEELNDFLGQSDIVIVALPLRKETYRLINKKGIESMRENTFIINIARGEIIDEDELYKALKFNRIRGAALDVFVKEPLSRKSKLWKLSNTIVTPHIAGNIHFLIEQIQNDFVSLIRKNA